MRSLGVPEEEITGKNADKLNKFVKWAETIQYAIGNPLYHWTHLELQRYFGIYEPLTKDNAVEIHDKINEMLAKPEFKVRKLSSADIILLRYVPSGYRIPDRLYLLHPAVLLPYEP